MMEKRILSIGVIGVFLHFGFWGSFLHFLSWPIAVLFGLAVSVGLERGNTTLLKFGRTYLLLMMWCGLMIGGLPMWLVITSPFIARSHSMHHLMMALLYDAVMSSLLILGVLGAHLYRKIRQMFAGAPHSGT